MGPRSGVRGQGSGVTGLDPSGPRPNRRERGALIKLLFVTAAYLPESVGGTQLHIKALIDEMRQDHEIQVVCRVSNEDDEEYARRDYEHDGIRVHTINNTFRNARDFFFLYSVPEVDRAFERILDEVAPDVVHVHHLTCLSTNFLTILARRQIPSVMTLHDFWMICPRGQRIRPDGGHCEVIDRERCHGCIRQTWDFLFPDRPLDDLTRRAEREMLDAWDDHVAQVLAAVDRIIVPATFYRDAFVERGLDPDKIAVIPHGLDPRPFVDVATRRTDAGKVRIGVLGTVIPSKGVHVLLDAVRGLGDRVTVSIHGEALPYHEDREYRTRLDSQLPDDVEVRFTGRYEPDEIPALLQEIDILVVPSIWHEAFGLTLREGFLAGVPVVASDLGALSEALTPERGLLFRAGDPDDLRRQLTRLLDNPELRDRVRGRAGWVRLPDAMAADTLRVYETARARSRPALDEHDPWLSRFKEQVRSVRALGRQELLTRAAKGLRRLAGQLDVDTQVPDLLDALTRHTWKIRKDYRTHLRESDWLRGERVGLQAEKKRVEEGRQAEAHAHETEAAWLRNTVEQLENDKAYLENALSEQATEYQAVKRAYEDVTRHHEELTAHLHEMKSALHTRTEENERLTRDLAEREAVLRRLARFRLIRVLARFMKIPEIKEYLL